MTDTPAFPTRRQLRGSAPRERHVLRWVIVGIVLLVIAWVLWIGIRGLIARDQLTGAIPLVEQLKSQALAGDSTQLQPVADELAHRADTAAALTSDPIWRVTELIPGIGPNLTAFRQSAEVVDRVTSGVMPPLLDLAGTLDFGEFLPKDGAIDLAAVQSLAPKLDAAGSAMASAQQLAGSISTAGTIPQIGDAVRQLVSAIQDAGSLVVGLDQTVKVLPAMLGADGPQRILLLVQNNAELRSTGGIAGAITEFDADGGRLAIATQTSAVAIGEFDAPVIPVTDTERKLYSERIARFMQNVTTTPDFARSGQIAAAMWKARYGEDVDAVVSVDPVMLSYLLDATGPIVLQDGTVLRESNAASMLLNEVYFKYPVPAEQDAFFASAAATIFDKLTNFDGDPKRFLAALARGAADHRIYVWSADDALQRIIAANGSTLTALDPRTDAEAVGIGVYLVDLTMSKVDWYLQPSITAGAVDCPAWTDHTYYDLTLTLTSTMPPGGQGVPDYVVGSTAKGDARGTMLTTAYFTMPTGYRIVQTLINGVNWAIQFVDAGDGIARYALQTELPPGATIAVRIRVFGPVGAPARIRVVHTPTSADFPVDTGATVACPSPSEFPTNPPGINAMGQ